LFDHPAYRLKGVAMGRFKRSLPTDCSLASRGHLFQALRDLASDADAARRRF
jgi:hypothetical protein